MENKNKVKKEKREKKENKKSEETETEIEKEIEENNENKRSIFVSGLPFIATYDEIRSLFEKCGEIISMKVPKFQDSGKNIGYAHIVYSDNESLEKVKFYF